MKRQFVHSSLIHTIGYDARTSTLEVEFDDGHINQYLNVSQETYNNLISATSHGRYFLANIRNKHEAKKIRSKTPHT